MGAEKGPCALTSQLLAMDGSNHTRMKAKNAEDSS